MQHPLLAIPVSVLVVLTAAGFGRRILARSGAGWEWPVEHCLFSAAVGLGIFAYVVLLCGVAGCLYMWFIWAVIAACFLVSLREIGYILREIRAGIRFERKRLGPDGGLLVSSVVALAALSLIRALAPPSGSDWDGLAYHLAVPKMYLSRHSIFYVPFMSHSNFPFLTEMLYTIGLSLGNPSLAKMFHWWMYVGSAIAIYCLGKRHVSSLCGSVGALCFMSVPVIFWEAGLAYADITTALYLTLAMYSVLNWQQTDRVSWLWIAGVMGGFALGTKVLASVPILVLCVWIFGASIRERKWGRGVSYALLVGAAAIAVGSPWYIKSWLYTGNPVYPFLYHVFGGRYWSPEAAETYRNAQLAFGMGRQIHDFVMLPWNLSVRGYRFFDTPSAFGLVGALFIGLIPVQVLTGKWNKTLHLCALTSLVFVAAWFVLMQQSRYLIGVLPAASLIVGSAVETAYSFGRVARGAVYLFVGLFVGASLLLGLALSADCVRAAVGIEPAPEYLARTLDIYEVQEYLNNTLPADARVVLFDEVRGYYLDRDYIWGNPGHHELIPWRRFKSGKDMVAFLRKLGYTHAMINWKFADQEARHEQLISDAIGHGDLREIYASGSVSAYEFK